MGYWFHDLEAMARALEEGDGVASGILLSKNISPERSHDWAEGAWNFVEGAPEWHPLLHRLLADTCVTDTWEEAKALQASRPEATVICRDGRMISAKGWQRRGKARNSRPGRQECEAARERCAATRSGHGRGCDNFSWNVDSEIAFRRGERTLRHPGFMKDRSVNPWTKFGGSMIEKNLRYVAWQFGNSSSKR